MTLLVKIAEAVPADAGAIAEIHLVARREAMPYLHQPYTADGTRDWFARVVGDRPASWWVARCEGHAVGYMRLVSEQLEHLYVLPAWQRRRVGTILLRKAQAISPHRLALVVFQRNTAARAFHEAHDFRSTAVTGGPNDENEPDVEYVWEPARPKIPVSR